MRERERRRPVPCGELARGMVPRRSPIAAHEVCFIQPERHGRASHALKSLRCAAQYSTREGGVYG
jgi:hypothetical protein